MRVKPDGSDLRRDQELDVLVRLPLQLRFELDARQVPGMDLQDVATRVRSDIYAVCA